jgi:hypothetical protein
VKSIELAPQAGRKRQSKATWFVHFPSAEQFLSMKINDFHDKKVPPPVGQRWGVTPVTHEYLLWISLFAYKALLFCKYCLGL